MKLLKQICIKEVFNTMNKEEQIDCISNLFADMDWITIKKIIVNGSSTIEQIRNKKFRAFITKYADFFNKITKYGYVETYWLADCICLYKKEKYADREINIFLEDDGFTLTYKLIIDATGIEKIFKFRNEDDLVKGSLLLLERDFIPNIIRTYFKLNDSGSEYIFNQ